MNADVKEKWVTALRSGEYKQAGGGLQYTRADGSQEFCCLGVLCDLAVKDGLGVRVNQIEGDDNNGSPTYNTYDGSVGFLPEKVREWAGMNSTNGRLNSTDDWDHASLASLNDTGYTFDQIADTIEENF